MSSVLDGLTDFDANLLHEDLLGKQDEYITRAKEVGVSNFVVPGSTLVDSAAALLLAKGRIDENGLCDVVATCGVHPYHTTSVLCSPDAIGELRRMLEDEQCHAVGECGLDYSDGFPSPLEQRDWFKAQIRLAVEMKKPLFMHERMAKSDFLSALEEVGFTQGKEPPVAAVVHCFTGELEELKDYIKRGFYIGLTGHCLHKLQPVELEAWMKEIPLDKLFIETDAPYMGFKGCRATEANKKNQRYPNVPAALPQILNAVAVAAKVPPPTLAAATIRNVKRFFPRAKLF